MADILFSSWGGSGTDNRGRPDSETQPVSTVNLPLEFDKGKKIKAFIGWDGIVIPGAEANIIDLIRAYLEAVQDESCGKCTPCRVGARIMATIMNRIADGQGKVEDLEHLRYLGESILKSSKCNLGHRSEARAPAIRPFQESVLRNYPIKEESSSARLSGEGDRALRERLSLPSSHQPIRGIDQRGEVPRIPGCHPGSHLSGWNSRKGLRATLRG